MMTTSLSVQTWRSAGREEAGMGNAVFGIDDMREPDRALNYGSVREVSRFSKR
jgi:hypothetical protein